MSGYLLWRARPEAALGLVSDQRVVPAADAPALLQAQALLARVDQLLSETEAQCQVLREAAREQGLREGLAEAEARLQAQLEEAQATQLAQLAAANQQLRQQWQQSLAELALAIHNKLMGELPAQEQLARLALQAARELLPARCWRLAVPPAQLAGLREALQALDPQNRAGLQDSELIADPALPALGCRLLTDLGSADASLETQLQRIASAWGLTR